MIRTKNTVTKTIFSVFISDVEREQWKGEAKSETFPLSSRGANIRFNTPRLCLGLVGAKRLKSGTFKFRSSRALLWGLIPVISLMFLLPIVAFARMSSESYVIDSDNIAVSGNQSTSTDYSLIDAFGEMLTGMSSSTNYREEEFITSYLFRALQLTSPASVTLTPKTISTATQTTTGTISNIQITDDGSAGWSLTMTSKHLTSTSTVRLLGGTNSTVDFTGTYNGLDGVLDPNGTFIVEITTGGAVGAAVFKWTDPAGNETTTVTSASSVTLSNGISATFAAATYVIGDKWSVGVDVFPYTGLQVTPGSVTVVNGDTGVTPGSTEILTGTGATSNAKSLMIGASNDSSGTYTQDEGLEVTIHSNSMEGSFSTITVFTVI